MKSDICSIFVARTAGAGKHQVSIVPDRNRAFELGATRDRHPIQLLQAMGSSGLFEPWRVSEAGVVVWFYEGPGGEYEYWPDGLSGPKRSVRAPLSNSALVADNDRMYHRIGWVGEPAARIPTISPRAQIEHIAGTGWVSRYATWAAVVSIFAGSSGYPSIAVLSVNPRFDAMAQGRTFAPARGALDRSAGLPQNAGVIWLRRALQVLCASISRHSAAGHLLRNENVQRHFFQSIPDRECPRAERAF
jgi:hypothetical protein